MLILQKTPLSLKRLWQKALFLFLFLAVLHPVLAQDPTPAVQPPADKTKFMGKISHWLAAYGISGEDFMREQRNGFKAQAYAEVYIEAVIDHDAWMFTMLNRVTKAKYAEKQTPFILFGLKFKPKDDNLNSYEISLSLEEGSAVSPQQENGIVSGASAKHLGGKTYTEPAEAGEDIEKAVAEALEGLRAKVGTSLAPNLMVRYQNEVFWNGHEIPILETDGNSIELEAIDKNGVLLNPNDIRWTNADPFQSKGIVDMTNIPSKPVTLTKGVEAMTVTLTRVSAAEDINELLKILIVEVLSAKKQEAQDTLTQLYADSVAIQSEVARLQSQVYTQNPQQQNVQDLRVVATFSSAKRTLPLNADLFQDQTTYSTALKLLEDLKNRKAIRYNVNVVNFANMLVDHPDKIKGVLDEMLLSSGRLIARLILNRDQNQQRNSARNIVVEFINTKIAEVANEN